MTQQSLFSFIFLFIWAFLPFSEALDGIPSARIDSKVEYSMNVDKFGINGDGGFVKIQDAINSVASGNKNWVRIKVHPGIYEEKVTIPEDKEFIILEGRSGNEVTIITYYEHGQTDNSATFTSWPDNFVAKDITFKNSYKQTTAVAARIYGDKSSFYRCGFVGFQDTLWDVQGRHFFKSCYTEGAIDFIWGGGQSFFESCLINVKAEMYLSASAGYITAQKRLSPNDPSGFVFKYCTIKGRGQVYWGRAYGPYSRVIFWDSIFDKLVVPTGWDAWHYRGHEGNFMHAEVGCTGPGSDTSMRVSWDRKDLKDADLQEYSRESFIDQDFWISRQPV